MTRINRLKTHQLRNHLIRKLGWKNQKIKKISKKQAEAELGQAQLKLELELSWFVALN